ncbi:ABC transporter substrate-binding protein [Weeksella virosa]|uniref:Periplasmic binding protein n=1 Tax=Weeksella virosa (strain ATCC 43766 / DSM 16922 / JCM 21250 / CCUG 30538 / CDC 9751 / IAM 14551 / NBRC 16016 / NCTC 11634 / CL345/78) TaxID=865938 RepID=F0P285_WEEVC|nr:ABC transporter substrate-binding protein [Weeksella virosa]ADX67775.1 periplasmic binding protein [Weeksella virosa DSM 16922]MDK7674320.1 ABC transporter substrate-binding protein [Weeksella virosa]SUP54074.1 iron-dicitrate transporter substrate-binding subunit [Weeksella virosa]VEH64598.1 iron-dicitrate transporter substrate-binding subunit [Weeksella virosa]
MKIQTWILYLLLSFSYFTCKKAEKPSSQPQLSYAAYLNYQKTDQQIEIWIDGQKQAFPLTKFPYKRIVVTQTASIGFLKELDALDKLIGVTDANFIYQPAIRTKIQANKILEFGNASELLVEKILEAKPDLIIASSNPSHIKALSILQQSGIDVLLIDDYKETSPIGRVEYLKLFGLLVGKEELAQKRFSEIRENYENTKTKIANAKANKHTTFVNTMYGDVWYLPGKETLQAKLLADANANYLWANDGDVLSINASFEQVYKRAKRATIWLNVSDFQNLDQMKAARNQYTWFDAYKTKNVYNTNRKANSNGGSDYFETGVVRPDLILQDLGKIYYPELFSNHSFYFYQKLL